MAKRGVKQRATPFGKLTELADALMRRGDTGVYQRTHAELKAEFSAQLDTSRGYGGRSSGGAAAAAASARTPAPAPAPAAAPASSSGKEAMWQYKWSKDAKETFGPFPTSHMAAWQAHVSGCGRHFPPPLHCESERVTLRVCVCVCVFMQGFLKNQGNPLYAKQVSGPGAAASGGTATSSSAADELMADFDDDDDDDEGGDGGGGAAATASPEWQTGIDFVALQQQQQQ